MSDAPNKWTVEVLKRYLENPVTEFSQDGLGYQTARPMGFGSYPTRLSLAWAVFRGKADALFWPRQTLRVNPIQDKLEAHADPDYPILLRPGYKLKVGETDGSWHYLTTKEIENLLMGLRESLPVGGPHLHRMSRSAFDVIREGFVTLGAGTSFRMGEAGRAAWTCPVCNQHLPSAVTTMFHSRQDTNGETGFHLCVLLHYQPPDAGSWSPSDRNLFAALGGTQVRQHCAGVTGEGGGCDNQRPPSASLHLVQGNGFEVPSVTSTDGHSESEQTCGYLSSGHSGSSLVSERSRGFPKRTRISTMPFT